MMGLISARTPSATRIWRTCHWRTPSARSRSAISAYKAELGFVPELFAYPYGETTRERCAMRSRPRDMWRHLASIRASPMHPKTCSTCRVSRLNEKYGAADRFRTLIAALPMDARDVTPSNITLDKSTNPPAFGFTAGESAGNLNGLACYASGLGKLKLQKLGARRVEARLPRRLKPGRHRVNCTLSAGGGRWRWYGRQFYVPKPVK